MLRNTRRKCKKNFGELDRSHNDRYCGDVTWMLPLILPTVSTSNRFSSGDLTEFDGDPSMQQQQQQDGITGQQNPAGARPAQPPPPAQQQQQQQAASQVCNE